MPKSVAHESFDLNILNAQSSDEFVNWTWLYSLAVFGIFFKSFWVSKSSSWYRCFGLSFVLPLVVIANLTFYRNIWYRRVHAPNYSIYYYNVMLRLNSELAMKCCTRVYEYFHDSKFQSLLRQRKRIWGLTVAAQHFCNNIKLCF